MTPHPVRYERITGEDGVGLHVARAGDGPPVVLLHGFPENHTSWRHQIGPLAVAGFGVLAPDLRGYGPSDKPAGLDAYRLGRLVDDVAALVRTTGHPTAHVVGHDWGGIIAWAFAAKHPDLLGRLAILNAPLPRLYLERVRRPSQLFKSWYVGLFQLPRLSERLLAAGDFRAVRTMFRRLPYRKGAFSEADIQAYVDDLARPGALTAALNYYRANVRRTPSEMAAVGPTTAETLVIWGERDPSLSTVLLRGLDRFAPHAEVRRLPDAGHWVQNEAPAEVNRLLLDFLTRDVKGLR